MVNIPRGSVPIIRWFVDEGRADGISDLPDWSQLRGPILKA